MCINIYLKSSNYPQPTQTNNLLGNLREKNLVKGKLYEGDFNNNFLREEKYNCFFL
jgi:hypothetical protein